MKTVAVCGNHKDDEYNEYVGAINQRIQELAATNKFFTTDAADLWETYLNAFASPTERQWHNCHACQEFIEKYGGLVTIAADGTTTAVVWMITEAPDCYKDAVYAMKKRVERASVTGVFYSAQKTLGKPETGVWRHFYFDNPSPYSALTKNAGQHAAEKKEEFAMLNRGLADFGLPVIDQALTLLKTEALYRSEKVLGVAEWLYNLHTAIANTKGKHRRNLVWLAVANAPVGFCHVRSTMIGTLLEDIASGMPFEEVRRRFANKMHPLQYQRPQAPPTDGNIARGEKVVEQLGIAKSLERRFAHIEELPLLWSPTHTELQEQDGVFAHLKRENAQPKVTNTSTPVTITWDKFQRTVLGECVSMSLAVEQYKRVNYGAITTAVHSDAPVIMQWGNSFAWYVYNSGSTSQQWNIHGSTVAVKGICLRPSMWADRPLDHHGKGVMFILEGAKDTRYERSGNALFPETLKSELHEIRATIEAYSRRAVLQGYEEASACGLILDKNSTLNAVFSVQFSNGQTALYKIDRWD